MNQSFHFVFAVVAVKSQSNRFLITDSIRPTVFICPTVFVFI